MRLNQWQWVFFHSLSPVALPMLRCRLYSLLPGDIGEQVFTSSFHDIFTSIPALAAVRLSNVVIQGYSGVRDANCYMKNHLAISLS